MRLQQLVLLAVAACLPVDIAVETDNPAGLDDNTGVFDDGFNGHDIVVGNNIDSLPEDMDDLLEQADMGDSLALLMARDEGLPQAVDRKGGFGGGGRGGGGGGGGSSGSSGGKGGSSGGKGGSSGGKGGSNGRGNTDDPPPPYSPRDNGGNNRGPPPPYSPGTYGNRGSYRNGWNGQYYPYSSYGYGAAVPVGLAFTPFFLAGPYGFYGPYGGGGGEGGSSRNNATVEDMYVNGSRLSNGTWVNGTLLNETYDDGKYKVFRTEGDYEGGIEIGDGVVVNGTFVNALSEPSSTEINPNVSSNGTTLHASKNGAHTASEWAWAPAALAAAVLVL